jgi:DNA-binding NarL/FixJ family response regulator
MGKEAEIHGNPDIPGVGLEGQLPTVVEDLDFAPSPPFGQAVEVGPQAAPNVEATRVFSHPGVDALTQREREILRLVGDGLSDRAIAERFGTSRRTVGVQLRSAYDKLGVRDRFTAAAVTSSFSPINENYPEVPQGEVPFDVVELKTALNFRLNPRSSSQASGNRLSGIVERTEGHESREFEHVQQTIEREPSGVGTLSRRQYDVFELMSQGFTDRQIGEALSISIRTAESHVLKILQKLGVHSRADARAMYQASLQHLDDVE